MRKYLYFFSFLLSLSVFGQTEYVIDGFSDRYKGKLVIASGSEDEVFKTGTITIIEKARAKEIIKIESDELTFDIDKDGNVATNVLELPYGEQSIIISQDFDFDGDKDLAILDGQFSCYHGPSFQVYLEKNNQLIHSPEFTRLAQEYCGMFRVDKETKTIDTMTKSGCCWHQFSKFEVIDGVPKPVLIIEEDATDLPYLTTKTIERHGSKMIESNETTIDFNEVVEIMSFELTKNQKRVVLFTINDRELNYVLLKPNKVVEFSYPIEAIYKNPDFRINKTESALTFNNKNVVYQIYEHREGNKVKEIGVYVKMNGKKYDLKGNLNSLKGSLQNVRKVKLDNVVDQ
ncbi:XAC2610-related protein [Aquimarina sediminis]|uniref:XAC2610-related protein n=1 Tax=Aquimarina sediminis TaxID=2070536 RepID=UPI000CA0806E|nr:hypothetical protein [Aquimarina sediminis]